MILGVLRLLVLLLATATPRRHVIPLAYITGYLAGGSTATGAPALPAHGRMLGVVAVDPRVIPLGSYVAISGLGTFRALDTGGLVTGAHVDVCVWSVAQAYAITGYRRVTWWQPH